MPVADDLDYVNSAPATSGQQLAGLSRDESDQIEKRVRRVIRVRDDFVRVPFPRLVSTSNAQAAAAVEGYKREAAIVDTRLSREVTLAVKATALADLCDQLRRDTGVRLEAGRSVADEKVTVLCKQMPLRDVMRQLARPFGYTWLRSGEDGEYRYEIVQDLRSQLFEEELRNRDRNAALLALAQNIERCRPLMNLSPEEALVRAKTAPPAEKEMLELLAGPGWGPLQMYFRLSPQELAALRAGQTLTFNQEPHEGELPLPADVARGVIERLPVERFLPRGDGFERTKADDPSGVPLTALPDVQALVTLTLDQSELGRFTLSGRPGFSSHAADTVHLPLGASIVGQSPRVLQPNNRLANAALARDPALRKVVTVAGVRRQASGVIPATGRAQGPSTDASRLTPDALPKVTSADVLEALHRASGRPIVADYYTRLYAPQDVIVPDRPLFDAMNHLADAMRMRWSKDGEWLQFRTTSYYDDRLKEVPNRLLARWSTSRKQRGFLSLEELMEIAQLTDAQLQAEDMAAGARELFGLAEWNFVRESLQVAHLRFLAGFTAAQRETALSPAGLPFAKMTLAQQQQFIDFAFVRYDGGPKGGNGPGPSDLQELAGALLRVEYAPPVGFEWRRPSRPGEELESLFRVHGRTREATLTAARQIDPQASPDQIVPAERSLVLAYITGRREDGLRGLAMWATDGGASIGRFRPGQAPRVGG